MPEYTYKDVIIDPEDPRIEIGAEYYFAYTARACVKAANSNDSTYVNRLIQVKKNDDYLFIDKKGTKSACIIRKKDPKKRYVPLNLNDREDLFNLMGSWLMNKTSGSYHCVITIKPAKNLVYIDGHGEIGPQELLEDFIFVFNDSPCGQLVEE